MERLNKVVLETPQDMHYEADIGEEGTLILRLVSNSSEKLEDKATFSQNHTAEEPEDKAKFFTPITVEDIEKVKNWLAEIKGETERECNFLERVKEAVRIIKYDYWIANLEPSVDNGKIFYNKGNIVGVGFSCKQWKQMAKDYAPKKGSRLAMLHELLIWYALRIVNGLWTLDYVANDSSSAGNYWNAPGATHYMEKTGAKECGGYRDGQGNSYKIVIREGGYALVGGYCNYDGDSCPVADVYYYDIPHDTQYDSSGVLVFLK